jgi:hypothetical protein
MKSPGPVSFASEFYQILMKNEYQSSANSSKILKRRESLQTSFLKLALL